MPIGESDLVEFLREMWSVTGGRTGPKVSMWDIGTKLAWERPKTMEVEQRLEQAGLIEARAIGGSIGLTSAGQDACEERFGVVADVQEKRRAFLRWVYDQVDGMITKQTNMWQATEALGLERDDILELFAYWRDRGMLEAPAIGGVVQLTLAGVQYVEQEGL